ncbi:hypothetical protein TrLO_g7435 [Triparma laevis f. longispina]|uniref:Uncharacterized protein n=1 Tax=Triparma laevis f. longispina TaxID=1714387 RepID=A0A9W7DQ40_9STRA|nr:hypothetical protein TrLO_g7435 [Triparma laevis f. longispina]
MEQSGSTAAAARILDYISLEQARKLTGFTCLDELERAIDSKTNQLSTHCARQLSHALDGSDSSSPLSPLNERETDDYESETIEGREMDPFSVLLVVGLLAGLIGLMVVVFKGTRGGAGKRDGDSPRKSPKRKGKKKNN